MIVANELCWYNDKWVFKYLSQETQLNQMNTPTLLASTSSPLNPRDDILSLLLVVCLFVFFLKVIELASDKAINSAHSRAKQPGLSLHVHCIVVRVCTHVCMLSMYVCVCVNMCLCCFTLTLLI